MNALKARKAIIGLIAVGTLTLTGCSWDNSRVYVGSGSGKSAIGEWTLRYRFGVNIGVDITLYRNNVRSKKVLGVSELTLRHYKGLRARGQSIERAAKGTLAMLRTSCRQIKHDQIRVQRWCYNAMGSGQWRDLREALVAIDHRRGACLTISIRHNSQTNPNWTFRSSSDRHCRP
jgi:hypothetical protein